MATYKFDATITVYGARSKQDVVTAMEVALDDYEAMNPGAATIVISYDEPKRVKNA